MPVTQIVEAEGLEIDAIVFCPFNNAKRFPQERCGRVLDLVADLGRLPLAVGTHALVVSAPEQPILPCEALEAPGAAEGAGDADPHRPP